MLRNRVGSQGFVTEQVSLQPGAPSFVIESLAGVNNSASKLALNADGSVTTHATVGTTYANQDWFISFATGNDSADGSVTHPLKTPAEWARRVAGTTPTKNGVIWVQIIDVDPANPPPIQITYAKIPSTCLLWISGKPAVVSGTTTTINTYRAENVSAPTPTPRAVTANALVNTTYQGPSPYRVAVPARNSRAWVSSHTGLEAAHVITISAPYAALPTNAVRVVRPLNATEFVTNDTMRIETLPVVGAIQLVGTHLDEDPSFLWNLANPSYAGGDACRVLVQNLEIGGAPPKPDYSVNGGATVRTSHSGAGQVWYDGCGVSSVFLADGQTFWWACRIDNLIGAGGFHQFYGCLLTGGPIIDGPVFATFGDCYFDQTLMSVQHGATIFLTGKVGGGSINNAFFDSSFFPTAIQMRGPNTSLMIENGGSVYGSNNTIGITCLAGARAYSVTGTGGDRLATLLCSTNCVSADGTTTGANTNGTFLYGVNTAVTGSGAGVYKVP